MAPDSPCWQQRHDSIRHILQTRSVKAALRDFQFSLNNLDNIRSISDASDASQADPSSSSHVHASSAATLGRFLDISLVISWSADGLAASTDPNPFRIAAAPTLRDLRSLSLQVQDFKSIKVLQKSAGSLVEVVKSRLDGRVYVLKSLVKGFARRNAAIQTPINESKLLQRQPHSSLESHQHHQLLTPQLLAAFQTQNSVHVLMEYVPSGDFSELLMAASSCGPDYPGRAPTGLLNEDWILRYSVDMVQAIAWVHAQGFAHRDIKPGNFLLDRSGHLKLCDFSSAAPFSDFASQAHTASTSSKPDRKVWAFYCSQPTGTCDYLSPEVLEAEETRVLQRQQQYDLSNLDDFLGVQRRTNPSSQAGSGSQPECTPGLYGPQVDWWSFGVMLYEMRFGVLPFFADKMEETYEKIKAHSTSLRFDASVACSTQLTLLIRGLVTEAARRLGRDSAQQVQQHAFYAAERIDWSKHWPLDAPFTPNAPGDPASDQRSTTRDGLAGQNANPAPTGIAAHFKDSSMSVVSSLPSFSALYAGNPDDFPAFADSREFEADSVGHKQDWWGPDAGISQEGEPDCSSHLRDDETQAANNVPPPSSDLSLTAGMTRSSSSPAVVLNASSSPSAMLRDANSSLAGAISPCISRSAPRWSDCDTTFVGFSYLPHRDAFLPPADAAPAVSTGDLSTAASFDDLAHKTGASPSIWPTSTPIASTPFHRGSSQASHSLTTLPTPPSFAPSPVAAVEPAGAEARNQHSQPRPPALPFQHPQNFVTPARKPSYMAIHDRFRQLQGQEAPIPEDASANYTPAVPSSPYPFPMASAVKNSHFTGGRKAVLNRRDLERARSATPGGGSVGSDSRQSGGSNAVREISEREAWDEMMAAVQKSVRKKQPAAVVPPTPPISSAVKPTGLPRSSTDPQLSASKPVTTLPSRRVHPQKAGDNTGSRRASRNALQPLEAPRQALHPARSGLGDHRSSDEKHGSVAQSQGDARQAGNGARLVAPRATFKVVAPESPEPLPAALVPDDSPRAGGLMPNQYALDIDMYDSDGSDDGHAAPRHLRHKKSARQLLIRAQERGTPTKPKRAQSPPLTEAFASAPSVAAVLEAAGARDSPPLLLGDHSVRSAGSSRDVSYEQSADRGVGSSRARALSMQRSGKSTPDGSREILSTSLGKTSVSFAPMAYVPVLGAIPPWRDARDAAGSGDGSGDGKGLPRDSGRGTRTIRRKDSGEMLSQYRKAKGMGRATSMLSLSERAKADADAPASRPDTAGSGNAALSTSPPDGDGEDDFILGHVESRMRSLAPGGSLPGRTIRRFSSVLSLKERERVTIERPASQDGGGKSTRGFGRFRSRFAPSTLCEEPSEDAAGDDAGLAHERAQRGAHRSRRVGTKVADDDSGKLGGGRRMGETLPRSFAVRAASMGASESPGTGDVSLMTGLGQRHHALQGSLLGLEQRLARLKARLED
ncbi:uncharacterized protein PAN0_035d6294 [Moesziomyces antarcticus]|uniref:Related to Serine/threonine-protein kinase CBK1 n=2 Tax=Pseudozyma antarctica TaxID=84753 RepID=A0A5C3FRP8_PSEA2|nr:uncharacterized protein PAN0_035d6294 [Moesziomyces antarcticus]GAK68062.1 conserved hypothetical protein [Moesziomyces antarcticus]SPO46992.1 related to Serine/threonine-protein kinase CBK1 [Moesziomyces antarcticus]